MGMTSMLEFKQTNNNKTTCSAKGMVMIMKKNVELLWKTTQTVTEYLCSTQVAQP